MNDFLPWFSLSDELIGMIIRLGIIIAILFFINYFGNTVIDKMVRKTITSDKYASAKAEKMREDTLISILGAILKISVWIFGSTLLLAQLGVNVGPLIAGASIAGIAIGFGAQAIVKDFVSGIFIILENQYRIGDVITLVDVTGTVEEITVRQTVLRDLEGRKHFIPNGQIGVTTNHTMDYSNLILNIEVSYDSDINKVEEVINKVGSNFAKNLDFKDKVIETPQFVRVQDFSVNAVVVRVAGKMKPGAQWQAAGEMRLRLKEAFDKESIEIPYQQVVIHQVPKDKNSV